MATVHGKNTVITVDSIDISAYCDSSEWSQTADTDEDTAYGDDDKTYVTSLRDATLTVGGKYDDGISVPKDTFEAAIDGDAAVPCTRSPEGTTTGTPLESFSGIVTSYVETNPVGGKITWSADIQRTGPTTRSTNS